MRNLNQNIELPNTLVQHCAIPIAPILSTQKGIESTFNLVDSLTSKSLLTEARGRVSENTSSTIEVKRLLTTASNCEESHLFLKVKVSVLNITYLTLLIKPLVSCFLPDLKVLGFHTPVRFYDNFFSLKVELAI